MKLTKSQFTRLSELTKDFSVVLFGALVVSGIFSQEPVRWTSLIFGILFLSFSIFHTLLFQKKGNSNG